jgi:ABC-type branched-subunit amino acid transport system substrate-binding protein
MKRFYGSLAVAALVLAATPAFAQIKIASVGPMTGQYAAFGEQLKKGAEMAVKDINAAVKVWADAATKAKSVEAAKVAAALRSGTYDSAVGPLTYDEKGDIKNPVYDIYVWKGGKSYPATK